MTGGTKKGHKRGLLAYEVFCEAFLFAGAPPKRLVICGFFVFIFRYAAAPSQKTQAAEIGNPVSAACVFVISAFSLLSFLPSPFSWL
ncbi:MAG: hypothetical protein IJC48_01405 [Clostridia bacterium]|nr:hypothetical protein [Clostridia bacterium]